MLTILLFFSSILSILSILPWITIHSDIDFLAFVTLGLKGTVGVLLPSIYAFVSLLFAIMLKKGEAKYFS